MPGSASEHHCEPSRSNGDSAEAPLSRQPGGEVWEAFRRIVGDTYLRMGEQAVPYTVEGMAPRAVVLPSSLTQLSDILALASRHRLITVPWGSGSQMYLGSPLPRLDVVCSMERLNQVIDYEPADMTIIAQAGISLSRLQEVLGKQGQFLPLDAPVAPTATLGGCLATRASGPLRTGFGTLRDRLLGVKVVLADGRVTKAGGRVVKNVAGYELGRLYTGALGTLAVVGEITLRVQPLPPGWLGLRVPLADESAAEAATAALLASEAEPTVAELMEPGMASALGWGATWYLALGYAGTASELAYVKKRVAELMHSIAEAAPLETNWPTLHAEMLAAHRGVLRGQSAGFISTTEPRTPMPGAEQADSASRPPVTARVHVLSSDLASVLREARLKAEENGLPLRAVGHSLGGIGRLHLPGDAPAEQLTRTLAGWRDLATARSGHLIIERGPQQVKDSLGVWGEPPADFVLMKAIKQRLDPHGILNTGRFVGGL